MLIGKLSFQRLAVAVARAASVVRALEAWQQQQHAVKKASTSLMFRQGTLCHQQCTAPSTMYVSGTFTPFPPPAPRGAAVAATEVEGS